MLQISQWQQCTVTSVMQFHHTDVPRSIVSQIRPKPQQISTSVRLGWTEPCMGHRRKHHDGEHCNAPRNQDDDNTDDRLNRSPQARKCKSITNSDTDSSDRRKEMLRSDHNQGIESVLKHLDTLSSSQLPRNHIGLRVGKEELRSSNAKTTNASGL